MNVGGSEYRGAEGWREFEEVLQGFKMEGVNLLVTGEVPRSVDSVATRTMLGDPRQARRRVVAFPRSPDGSAGDYLPPGVTAADDDVRVVRLGADARSAAAGVESAASTSDLDRFRDDVVRAIGCFDEAADGLEPSELRLGVQTLSVLFAEYDRRDVERFLRTVTAMVRGVSGMGHYRLARPDDSDLVRSLSSLFDVRVELRKRGSDPPEQRWHVPERGISTTWVQL